MQKQKKIKVSKGVVQENTQEVVQVTVAKKPKDLNKLARLISLTGANYDTTDAEVYKDRIEKMSINDLQNEALRVGLKSNIDNSTKNIAIGTMMNLFYDNIRQLTADISGTNQANLNEKKRQKLTELMAAAR